MEPVLRTLLPSDNQEIAAIIRETLTEFGADKPGTVFFDPTTDHLSDLFLQEGSHYFVVTEGTQLLGGAGIFPTPGLPEGWCELVKLYLKKEGRGKGLGQLLIKKCFETAKAKGFHTVYLETMPELDKAVPLYEFLGFEYLPGPQGNSGHFGCGIWMKKTL